jgi:hypothetical protein
MSRGAVGRRWLAGIVGLEIRIQRQTVVVMRERMGHGTAVGPLVALVG